MNTAVASRESYTCSLCLWHAAAKQLRWLIEKGVLVTLILHGEKDHKEVDWVTKSLIQRFRSNSGVTSGDVVIIRAEILSANSGSLWQPGLTTLELSTDYHSIPLLYHQKSHQITILKPYPLPQPANHH